MQYDYDIDETVKTYFKSLKPMKPLTKKEEHDLLTRYKVLNDINARNKLINSNLRYACKIANSYRNHGVSYSDLISEANNGLIEAIDKFDLSRDVKLISYSKWWIMQKMQSAIERKRRMPESEIPEERDTPVLDDDDITASERIVYTSDDTFLIDTEVDEEEKNIMEFVDDLITCLSAREKDIVNMYYGRGHYKENTLDEIGKKYKLTKERVRQILNNALTKMRSKSMMTDTKYLSR